MTYRTLFVGLVLFTSTACTQDDSSTAAPCQTMCERAGQADPGCNPADCVPSCEAPRQSCDAEYRAHVQCLADTPLLGCLNGVVPMALGDCEAQRDALNACEDAARGTDDGSSGGDDSEGSNGDATGGTTTTGADPTDTTGEGSTGAPSGPCDPLDAQCVDCAGSTCDAPQACCWSDAPSCGDADSCVDAPVSSCDGAEDCPGAQCCVRVSIASDGGAAAAGLAECSATTGSACCTATPGTPGCAAEPNVASCVCQFDDFCCSTEWDAQCAARVEQNGCGTCTAGCEFSNGSTSTGSSIRSVACRSNADCAGVVGDFNVPYGTCCRGTGFDVGACVSDTFAATIAQDGGSCG